MKFSKGDTKEIKRQDKLLRSNTKIWGREHGLKGYDTRNPYQRDYARILYSSAFRRLQGKMQILGIETSAFFRNRLTHSLEVAQIAKGIRMQLDKECYGGTDTTISDLFLLDAAALAHDIGHPAFGHKGERTLNTLLSPLSLHFEGNAQNFRVLRRLEKKDPEFTGLNLSYRTLLAINKYLVRESSGTEKFMYAEDFDFLEEFRAANKLSKVRTIDVQIIELADDIAYAVHDLEDALSQNYFTIDEIIYEMMVNDKSTTKFSDQEIDSAHKTLLSYVNKSRTKANKSSSHKNLQEFSQVFRKSLISSLTHLFINDVILGTVSEKEAYEHGTIAGARELKLGATGPLCKILSKKIFKGVTRNPNVALYEERGAKVITELFNLYTSPTSNKNGQLLPPDFRPIILETDSLITQQKKIALAASNYIAGMMDTYAIECYENLFDKPFNSIII